MIIGAPGTDYESGVNFVYSPGMSRIPVSPSFRPQFYGLAGRSVASVNVTGSQSPGLHYLMHTVEPHKYDHPWDRCKWS